MAGATIGADCVDGISTRVAERDSSGFVTRAAAGFRAVSKAGTSLALACVVAANLRPPPLGIG